MSFESVAIFMRHSRSTGTARLVGIGIASHDGDGGAFPSHASLSIYANVTEANVAKAIKRLQELGEVAVEVNGGGYADTPHYLRSNRYQITLTCPPGCDGSKQHRIICPVCRKPVPAARRFQGMHGACEAQARQVGVGGIGADPGSPADAATGDVPLAGIATEGGSEARPGSPNYPQQVSGPSPKEPFNHYKTSETAHGDDAGARAGAHVTDRWAIECPARWDSRGTGHEVDAHGSKCRYCCQPVVLTTEGLRLRSTGSGAAAFGQDS